MEKRSPILLLCIFLPLIRGHSLFTCEPITVPRCMKMDYNMTFFPNLMGHYDQGAAAVEMKHFLPLANLECSPDVETFLCQAFVPTCTEKIDVVPPCRKLCEKVYSDCKKLMDTFEIRWPEELECNRLKYCDGSVPVTLDPHTESLGPQKKTEQVQRNLGIWCPRHLKTSGGQGYKFLGIDQCAPPCPNMYFKSDELEFAKSFIGIVSIFCLCATLFTFLTFLIDVKRFRYPERPIIYYSVCYSIVSLMYFIGFLLGNSTACNKANEKLELGDTVVLGSQNKACTVVFMFLYFFTMAGTVWWVILTITWFLAAGRKWSCEAIEQKAVWFHAFAWGVPGFLTVMLLAMNKVEGDNISGVCFVGLYDLDASRYFVLLPLCLCVFVGLSLLLAGIISLNHVRQVIQHDGRNQEKLKKFMIRIGVFSGLYLVPLVTLLGCYVYELVNRITWEITCFTLTLWISLHCKYIIIYFVFKKTCTEWAGFFKRNRKRDPISESRRVLQESCEFFLKHNSKVKHKKKHYKPSSHKLKVISKSMGTSTGATANHGTSAVAITDQDFLGQETLTEIQTSPEASVREVKADRGSSPKAREQGCGEPASPAASRSKLSGGQDGSKVPVGSGRDKSSASESARSEGRGSPKSDVTETGLVKSNNLQVPSSSEPSSFKGSTSLLVHSTSGVRKEQCAGSHSDT
uniref:Frizzled-6 n=1 Tax=Jaculus jaculus TaxID=51337 RepID=A0A8C5KG12_JACJA